VTRALVIAYYFPPVGGAGSQRWLKLARYLPEVSETTVRVLTGPGTTGGRWSPRDESLAAELPAQVVVDRVPGPEPRTSSSLRAKAERWLRFRSAWEQWWVEGLLAAGGEAGADADVVVASMSPYASATAATALSERLGKPWIADLRDPWALDEMMLYPTALHRRRELRRMRQMLATAAAIVTTTPEAARRIASAFPELGTKPVASIANGFDADDFTDVPPPRGDDAFRIVHTGYLHTALGQEQRRSARLRRLLGGDQGASILTRSHIFLLEAIERVTARQRHPDLRIELHLAGVLSEHDREAATRHDFVRLHGYVEHHEAVELMRSADLLFLPMQKMPPGVRSGIVPGKTYEYIAAARPILAAVPEGDAREILEEAGTARICEPDDVSALAAAIEGELVLHERGGTPPPVAANLLERFERRALAARYAALLASFTASGGRWPREARAPI
jgi:glycosyltransferase involved in cell wall biosynthesis